MGLFYFVWWTLESAWSERGLFILHERQTHWAKYRFRIGAAFIGAAFHKPSSDYSKRIKYIDLIVTFLHCVFQPIHGGDDESIDAIESRVDP